MKNKKLAIQLAKRYIDDYKKMQADPKYGDEVRMDPGAYKPKVDRKGKPKEAEQFEQWADNIEKSALEIPAEEPKAEGNEFAQAVQKAKAAGMKAGDKFKVGDKEYTLKDAIELAGLNLNEFFQEEDKEVSEDAGVDQEVDRIVRLANYQ